jgi:tetratricopeptide (TPR) repeat protein
VKPAYKKTVRIAAIKDVQVFFFIASFSYVFLLGVLFDRLYVHRFKGLSPGFSKLLTAGLFLLMLTGYSYTTVQQNKVWENSYTLWADAVEKSPESSTANALMGVVYMEMGMNKEALGCLEKAVQLMPEDYLSRNNLGIVYGRMGNPEKALQELLIASSIRPDLPAIKVNLAVHYARIKEYEKAEEILKALLANGIWESEIHYRLALLYKSMGRYDAAVTEATRSLELEPRVIDPYVLLGSIYLNVFQDVEKAKYYFTKGIEAAPKGIPKAEELRWVIQDLERNR